MTCVDSSVYDVNDVGCVAHGLHGVIFLLVCFLFVCFLFGCSLLGVSLRDSEPFDSGVNGSARHTCCYPLCSHTSILHIHI